MTNESFFQMPEEEAKALLNALAKSMKASFPVLQIALDEVNKATEGIGDAHDAWLLDTLQKLVILLRDQRRIEPRDDL